MRELIFRDGGGAEYQPVKHFNRKTGVSAYRVKPPGASNETADCIELDTIEDLAKAMLVDGLPARVKALKGGPVNYLKFGAQKLVSYELEPSIAATIGVAPSSQSEMSQADKIRRVAKDEYVDPARRRGERSIDIVSGELHRKMGLSNAVPAICSALESEAFCQVANVRLINRSSPIDSDKPSSTIRYTFDLEPGVGVTLDRGGLENLRRAFLQLHSDFETFSNCPSFAADEGNYKQALVEAAARLLAEGQGESDRSIGASLIELLAGRAGLPCNLIDWRAQQVLDNARRTAPDLVEDAAGKLARSTDPIAAVIEFVGAIWPAMRGDLPSNPYAESRMFPTMLRALVDPRSVLAIRSRPTDNAARMLLGRPAFANAPLTRTELSDVTAMAREIMRVMEEEWNWAPRDLWDVQGFLWETCQKVLAEREMTDEEVLARFDGNLKFREARRSWSDEQKRALCSMARAVNSAGLDWYHTNIPQIRFGRKDDGSRDAAGTLGSIQLRTDRVFVEFSHQHDRLGLDGRYEADEESAEAFASAISDAHDEIAAWKPNEPTRPGRWPDEYETDDADMSASTLDMKPINLILYGPPGTGKTYHTMEVAVRCCGENPAEDRAELRQQYEQLRKAKRIEFVTFHQNFAYEEFVEGLRPQTGGDDQDSDAASAGFRLEPIAGIFRQLCTRADEARKAGAIGPSLDLKGRKVFKMSLGRAGLEDEIFEDAYAGNYIVLGWGGEIDWSNYESYRAIHERWNKDHPGTHGSDSNIAQVNRFVVDMKPGDLVVVSYGNSKIRAIAEVTGPYEFAPTETRDYNHRRQVKWLRRFETPIDSSIVSSARFSQKSCYPIQEVNLDRDGLATLLPEESSVPTKGKDFVLVIDEINRANISKVFGELITLIEPDKRLGMEEELTVKLPYSAELFGVPANLHVIGTMNTADRSIMQIDTALRRRFRFEEMAPKSDLLGTVAGIDLAKVLDTINARIEYLLDRDHAIGHAFFMGDGGSDRTAIDDTMRFKIIPLLQEYFFDDWRNIAAVLGKGFVRGETLPVPPGIDDRGERTRWTIRWQEGANSGFPSEAYTLLLRGTEAEVDRSGMAGEATGE